MKLTTLYHLGCHCTAYRLFDAQHRHHRLRRRHRLPRGMGVAPSVHSTPFSLMPCQSTERSVFHFVCRILAIPSLSCNLDSEGTGGTQEIALPRKGDKRGSRVRAGGWRVRAASRRRTAEVISSSGVLGAPWSLGSAKELGAAERSGPRMTHVCGHRITFLPRGQRVPTTPNEVGA